MSVPDGYERQKMHDLEEVSRRMLEMPQVVAAIENRTAIFLTCPRGHKLVTVELSLDSDGVLINVLVVSTKIHPGGSAATRDDPWSGRVPTDDVISPLSTRFTCRACGKWSDRVTTPRLLKSITAALVLRHPSASVTGSLAGVSRVAHVSAKR